MKAVEQHGGDGEGDQGEHHQGRGAEYTDNQDEVSIGSVFPRNYYLISQRGRESS